VTPKDAPEPPVDPITLDDLRHKALAIRQEVRDEVDTQITSRRNQAIVVGIAVLAIGFGLVYFFGTRAGRAAAQAAAAESGTGR
jgi:hypothetical protein